MSKVNERPSGTAIQPDALLPAGPAAPIAPDPAKVMLMALKVWGYKQGEVVSLMIHLGDRLGLCRAMAGSGPVTAGELASRTGLNARWLL